MCESGRYDKHSNEGRAHSLKEQEEGKNRMCEIMENLMEKRSRNDRTEVAERIISDGKYSLEDISKLCNLPLSTIQELDSSMAESKSEQG